MVLLISDGWDRGDPAVLVRELARVRRSCRRLIWLNPLLGAAGYEPLTRGMTAALPLVDDFMPVHNLESLEKLVSSPAKALAIMKLTGEYTFDASPDDVWKLLMDTAAIAGCLPGCEALRHVGGNRYEAELKVAVAAVSGEYWATIEIADQTPPTSYRLIVDALGRMGFVKGNALMTLEPRDGRTTVVVDATADVGGAVARVGQRLMEGVGRMMMNRFFACLAQRLTGVAVR